ncbi:MAG: hypothetical protein OXU62_06020 [Gammaproteobacteria bacterium]|nr:hypothetical protein [Gammaproteobacteria bacterium]
MAEFESGAHRRGLTLGLTMAEIFILILFLLLLLFLTLHKEYEQTKVTLAGTRDELTEITTEYESRASLPDEIRRLERNNAELRETVTEFETENTITKSLLEENEKRLDAAEKSLAEARDQLPTETRELVERVESLEQDLASAQEEKTDSAQQLEKVRKRNAELRNQLYASKGVDPPCWYEVVQRKGKRHEKPHYLLDVAVHDEFLRVRVNRYVPLPGYAIDEGGQRASTSYAEEYAKLPLARLATAEEKRMSLEEFHAFAEPVKRMGKDGQIRDYACVFYAKIWDHTSATAKGRWKRAREKIEDFFYPLLVRNDPWE